MAAWWAAASERRQLAALDDNSLNDLGISKAQARAEAARRPWDLPEHLAREIEGRPAVRRRWR